jgi:hypothetical protein
LNLRIIGGIGLTRDRVVPIDEKWRPLVGKIGECDVEK